MKFQKFNEWLEAKTILGGGDLGHTSNPAVKRNNNAQLVMPDQNEVNPLDKQVLDAFEFSIKRDGGISQTVKNMYQHSMEAHPHLMGEIRKIIARHQKPSSNMAGQEGAGFKSPWAKNAGQIGGIPS